MSDSNCNKTYILNTVSTDPKGNDIIVTQHKETDTIKADSNGSSGSCSDGSGCPTGSVLTIRGEKQEPTLNLQNLMTDNTKSNIVFKESCDKIAQIHADQEIPEGVRSMADPLSKMVFSTYDKNSNGPFERMIISSDNVNVPGILGAGTLGAGTVEAGNLTAKTIESEEKITAPIVETEVLAAAAATVTGNITAETIEAGLSVVAPGIEGDNVAAKNFILTSEIEGVEVVEIIEGEDRNLEFQDEEVIKVEVEELAKMSVARDYGNVPTVSISTLSTEEDSKFVGRITINERNVNVPGTLEAYKMEALNLTADEVIADVKVEAASVETFDVKLFTKSTDGENPDDKKPDDENQDENPVELAKMSVDYDEINNIGVMQINTTKNAAGEYNENEPSMVISREVVVVPETLASRRVETIAVDANEVIAKEQLDAPNIQGKVIHLRGDNEGDGDDENKADEEKELAKMSVGYDSINNIGVMRINTTKNAEGEYNEELPSMLISREVVVVPETLASKKVEAEKSIKAPTVKGEEFALAEANDDNSMDNELAKMSAARFTFKDGLAAGDIVGSMEIYTKDAYDEYNEQPAMAITNEAVFLNGSLETPHVYTKKVTVEENVTVDGEITVNGELNATASIQASGEISSDKKMTAPTLQGKEVILEDSDSVTGPAAPLAKMSAKTLDIEGDGDKKSTGVGSMEIYTTDAEGKYNEEPSMAISSDLVYVPETLEVGSNVETRSVIVEDTTENPPNVTFKITEEGEDYESTERAKIVGDIDGALGENGKLAFFTHGATGGMEERMQIDGDGNVNIEKNINLSGALAFQVEMEVVEGEVINEDDDKIPDDGNEQGEDEDKIPDSDDKREFILEEILTEKVTLGLVEGAVDGPTGEKGQVTISTYDGEKLVERMRVDGDGDVNFNRDINLAGNLNIEGDINLSNGLSIKQVPVLSQIGEDIDGKKSGELLGYAVSLSDDGSRMAVGSFYGETKGDSSSGTVRVYEWDATNEDWKQLGSDFNGYSVALSGNGSTLAVGNPFDTNNNGVVKTYTWNDSSWVAFTTELTGTNNDLFGFSLSLNHNGTKIAVGAPTGKTNSSGEVSIWTKSGNSWNTASRLDLSITNNNTYFGYSVSLNHAGTRIAVGAPNYSDDEQSWRGKVIVYQEDNGSWTKYGDDINGSSQYDRSGISVSLDKEGNKVAIGVAQYDDETTNDNTARGYVRVYEANAESSVEWSQLGENIDGEADGDESGKTVSLSNDGKRLVVGSYFNDDNGDDSGHARVYEWKEFRQVDSDNETYYYQDRTQNASQPKPLIMTAKDKSSDDYVAPVVGTYYWSQYALDVDGERAGDFSGAATMSGNGRVIAIGAYKNDGVSTDTEDDRGHVRVFEIGTSVFMFEKNMNGVRIDSSGGVNVNTGGSINIENSESHYGAVNTGTVIQVEDAKPYITLKNTSNEHTDGGAESRIIFEDHTDMPFAKIEASHDGSEDDTKGKFAIYTNDGTNILKERVVINSEGNMKAQDIFAENVIIDNDEEPTLLLQNSGTGHDGASRIAFNSHDETLAEMVVVDDGAAGNKKGEIAFFTYEGLGGTGTEKMAITTEKVQVNGEFEADTITADVAEILQLEADGVNVEAVEAKTVLIADDEDVPELVLQNTGVTGSSETQITFRHLETDLATVVVSQGDTGAEDTGKMVISTSGATGPVERVEINDEMVTVPGLFHAEAIETDNLEAGYLESELITLEDETPSLTLRNTQDAEGSSKIVFENSNETELVQLIATSEGTGDDLTGVLTVNTLGPSGSSPRLVVRDQAVEVETLEAGTVDTETITSELVQIIADEPFMDFQTTEGNTLSKISFLNSEVTDLASITVEESGTGPDVTSKLTINTLGATGTIEQIIVNEDGVLIPKLATELLDVENVDTGIIEADLLVADKIISGDVIIEDKEDAILVLKNTGSSENLESRVIFGFGPSEIENPDEGQELAEIVASSEGTGDDFAGKLTFSTFDSGSTGPNERMVINTEGDVEVTKNLDLSGNLNIGGNINFSQEMAIKQIPTLVQLGEDVSTALANEKVSLSFSSDGSRLAIGFVRSENSEGRTEIYEWNSTTKTWEQLGDSIVDDGAAGYSVAFSDDGQVIAVGAPGDDGEEENIDDDRGTVRVYKWDTADETWRQRGSDITDNVQLAFRGASVSLNKNGTYVAIGAPSRNNDGQVMVYQWRAATQEDNNEHGPGTGEPGDAVEVGQFYWFPVDSNGITITDTEEELTGMNVFINDSGDQVIVGTRTKLMLFNYDNEERQWEATTTLENVVNISVNNDFTRVHVMKFVGEDFLYNAVYELKNGTYEQLGANINMEPSDYFVVYEPNLTAMSGDGNTIATYKPNGSDLVTQVYQWREFTQVDADNETYDYENNESTKPLIATDGAEPVVGEFYWTQYIVDIGDDEVQFGISALNSDGSRLAVGGFDGSPVRVYDLDANNSSLAFFTQDTERMRIDPAGNVGIGTTSPGTILQIESAEPHLTLKNNTDGDAESKIIFEDHEDEALVEIKSSHDGTGGNLVLAVYDGATGPVDRLTIDSQGVVTINGDLAVDNSIVVDSIEAEYLRAEDIDIVNEEPMLALVSTATEAESSIVFADTRQEDSMVKMTASLGATGSKLTVTIDDGVTGPQERLIVDSEGLEVIGDIAATNLLVEDTINTNNVNVLDTVTTVDLTVQDTTVTTNLVAEDIDIINEEPVLALVSTATGQEESAIAFVDSTQKNNMVAMVASLDATGDGSHLTVMIDDGEEPQERLIVNSDGLEVIGDIAATNLLVEDTINTNNVNVLDTVTTVDLSVTGVAETADLVAEDIQIVNDTPGLALVSTATGQEESAIAFVDSSGENNMVALVASLDATGDGSHLTVMIDDGEEPQERLIVNSEGLTVNGAVAATELGAQVLLADEVVTDTLDVTDRITTGTLGATTVETTSLNAEFVDIEGETPYLSFISSATGTAESTIAFWDDNNLNMVEITGSLDGTGEGGRLAFSTHDGDSGVVEQLIINSDGDVEVTGRLIAETFVANTIDLTHDIEVPILEASTKVEAPLVEATTKMVAPLVETAQVDADEIITENLTVTTNTTTAYLLAEEIIIENDIPVLGLVSTMTGSEESHIVFADTEDNTMVQIKAELDDTSFNGRGIDGTGFDGTGPISKLTFSTHDGISGPVERMAINGEGDVEVAKNIDLTGNLNIGGNINFSKEIAIKQMPTLMQQLGQDIETYDSESYTVTFSNDGEMLAIGASGANRTEVYTWNARSKTWEQQGATILGEENGDQSGFSIALNNNGTTIAIGAKLNDTASDDTEYPDIGNVRVYDWREYTENDDGEFHYTSTVQDGTQEKPLIATNGLAPVVGEYYWTQRGFDINGPQEESYSGFVSLDSTGDKLIVGAPGYQDNSSTVGMVRIWTWRQLTAEDVTPTTPIFVSSNTPINPTEEENENVGQYFWISEPNAENQSFIVSEGLSDTAQLKLRSDGESFIIVDKNELDNNQLKLYRYDSDNERWNATGLINDVSEFSINDDFSRVAVSSNENNTVTIYNINDNLGFEQYGAVIEQESANITAIALSNDGETVALGEQENDGESLEADDNRGSVRVYQWKLFTQFDADSETYHYEDFDQDVLQPKPLIATGGEEPVVGEYYWTQYTFDLDGKNLGDGYGNALSLNSDGTRLAVAGVDGTPVRVYEIGNNASVAIFTKNTERMRIDPQGNVGIGTTNPGTILQIEDAEPHLTLKNTTYENTDGGAESKIIFEDHADNALVEIKANHDGTGDDARGNLVLAVHDGVTGPVERVTIDSEGLVTINGDLAVEEIEALEINALVIQADVIEAKMSIEAPQVIASEKVVAPRVEADDVIVENIETANLVAEDIDIINEEPVLALMSTATGEEQSGIIFMDSSNENMVEMSVSLNDKDEGSQLVFSIDNGVTGPEQRLTVNSDGITVNGDIAADGITVNGDIAADNLDVDGVMNAETTITHDLEAVDIEVENLLAEDIVIQNAEPALELISTASGQERSGILFADSNEESMATMVAKLDATGNSELVFAIDNGVSGPEERLTVNSDGITVNGDIVADNLVVEGIDVNEIVAVEGIAAKNVISDGIEVRGTVEAENVIATNGIVTANFVAEDIDIINEEPVLALMSTATGEEQSGIIFMDSSNENMVEMSVSLNDTDEGSQLVFSIDNGVTGPEERLTVNSDGITVNGDIAADNLVVEGIIDVNEIVAVEGITAQNVISDGIEVRGTVEAVDMIATNGIVTANFVAEDIDIVGDQPVLALMSTATGEEQSGILFVDSSRENNMAEINSSLDATGGNQLVFSIDDGVAGPQERLTVNSDGITVNGNVDADVVDATTMIADSVTARQLDAEQMNVENVTLTSNGSAEEESTIVFEDALENSTVELTAGLDGTGPGGKLTVSVDDGVNGPQERLAVTSDGITVNGDIAATDLVVEGIDVVNMGAETTTTSELNATTTNTENLLAQDIIIRNEEPLLALISSATGQEESGILFADSNEDNMATMVARLDATGNSELVFSVDDGVTGPQERLTINSAGDVTVDGTLVVGELKTIAASSVTQSDTNGKLTEVIINSTAGSIITANSQLNGDNTARFRVTNNAITVNHIINVNVAVTGSSYTGEYYAGVTNVSNGSFEILIENVGADASEAVRLNFYAVELGL